MADDATTMDTATVTAITNGSSCSSSSTLITDMSQDQLLSILLLLPVDSILSFAMTCNKARLVCNSGTLWQSICARDWGLLDYHSSSNSQSQSQSPPDWKTIYKRVSHLDRVSCFKLSDDSDDNVFMCPRPRASHSLNFVSGCLVLFGGGSEGGRHLDDTWIAYIGNDFRRMIKWQRVVSGTPSGRFGHSCLVLGDCLVLFGGINDSGIRQNDTWIGQIGLDGMNGITLSWRLLDVGAVAPPSRGAHAGCSIDNRRMLIHGGIGLSGMRLGDTWVLDVSEDLCFGTWHEVVTHPMAMPSPRSGHTLSYVGGSKTVLFGGRGMGYEVLNDVWYFDSSEGHLEWVQVLFDLRDVAGGLSLPRVGHSAIPVLGGRVLVYGGEDSYRHRKSDFWLLDINLGQSYSYSLMRMQPPVTQNQNQNQRVRGVGGIWRKLKTEEGYEPKCRSFHRACADESGRVLYVFGGMVDGVLQPAESSGLRFDGELFVVELVI